MEDHFGFDVISLPFVFDIVLSHIVITFESNYKGYSFLKEPEL